MQLSELMSNSFIHREEKESPLTNSPGQCTRLVEGKKQTAKKNQGPGCQGAGLPDGRVAG
jgi:hypothetical protein